MFYNKVLHPQVQSLFRLTQTVVVSTEGEVWFWIAASKPLGNCTKPALSAWAAWRGQVWRHQHCPATDTQRCDRKYVCTCLVYDWWGREASCKLSNALDVHLGREKGHLLSQGPAHLVKCNRSTSQKKRESNMHSQYICSLGYPTICCPTKMQMQRCGSLHQRTPLQHDTQQAAWRPTSCLLRCFLNGQRQCQPSQ